MTKAEKLVALAQGVQMTNDLLMIERLALAVWPSGTGGPGYVAQHARITALENVREALLVDLA